MLCPPVKTSFSLAENVNDTPVADGKVIENLAKFKTVELLCLRDFNYSLRTLVGSQRFKK